MYRIIKAQAKNVFSCSQTRMQKWSEVGHLRKISVLKVCYFLNYFYTIDSILRDYHFDIYFKYILLNEYFEIIYTKYCTMYIFRHNISSFLFQIASLISRQKYKGKHPWDIYAIMSSNYIPTESAIYPLHTFY